MPVLNSIHEAQIAEGDSPELLPASRRTTAFPACANPRCKSSWLQLWRNRRVPVLEGGWLCSPACTRARVEELLHREYVDSRPSVPHQHRIPIGLVLLRQGWIEHQHLKDALDAQRNGSGMRLGEWLVANRGLSELQLTQALGLQWGCPVFSLRKNSAALPVTLIPRLIVESFDFVPLRLASSGRMYLAFEDRMDHSLALAVERMTGVRVVPGLLSGSEFSEAQRNLVGGRFPRARLIEAGSVDLLAEAMTRHIEKEKPVEARMVRIHDLLWLRLWRTPDESDVAIAQGSGVEDVIGSIIAFT